MDPNTARELLLLVLLVKILVAASIASILARFASFKQLVFLSDKTLRDRFVFGIVLGLALFFGVTLRVIFRFPSPDLSLEGAVLAGVLGGYLSGTVAGGLAALPALLLNQEVLALPAMLLAGAAGGFARQLIPNKDDVWHFSPFIDLNLYRWFRQRFGRPRGDWQMFFSIYFGLTGMHALHMVVGIGVLAVLVRQAWRGRFSPEYYSPVELSGLYWHFVDIVWIFLFPLLYLIGGHA